jgi:hypothetical protein
LLLLKEKMSVSSENSEAADIDNYGAKANRIPNNIQNLRKNFTNLKDSNNYITKTSKQVSKMVTWKKYLILLGLLFIFSGIVTLFLLDPQKFRSFGGFFVGTIILMFIFTVFYFSSKFIMKLLF